MGRTFFRRANLIDGINPPRKNSVVVVEDERITNVSSEADAPAPSANDVIFDLDGRSLMPAMVQCHYHVAYDNIGNLLDLDLKHPATMLTLIAAKNAELLLRCGFTGAVGAGSLHNIDVTLKQAINRGLIQGPRFVACGRDIVTTGDSVDFHPSWWKLQMDGLGRICDGPDEFRKAVRDEIKQGVDMMDDECIERLVEQGAFVTPSLYFPYMVVEEKRRTGRSNWGGADEMERGLENSRRTLPKANAAGVKFVIGDDFGTSAMPHGDYAKELEAYVKGAAVPPLEVIRWATRNGAELLGMKDDLGTIENGKLADLLVVNGDPSADITVLQDRANLHVIMKSGKFVECQLTPSKATAKAA